MPENRTMYKRLYILGIAAYFIMLILSILFYKERAIILDAAFVMFNLIKDSGFCILIGRFGAFFTQLLPIIAIKTAQPVSTILACYSVGYVIYYFITYFICGSILKRYDLALVILFMNILFVSHTFYWMLSELPQAMALLMVLLALAGNRQTKTNGALIWSIILLVEVMMIFFHPLILFAIAFAVIFFKLSKRPFIDSKILYTLCGVYILWVALKVFVFKTSYEAHSASGLKNFITQFPDYFTLFSNKRFLYNCLVKYYWIPIIFSVVVILYVRTKEYRKLLFFVAFFLGYLMLVNISYPTAITCEFYIENLYLPLSVFLALPFVFDVLPVIEKNNIGMLTVVLIIISGCIRIYMTHTVYTDRLVLERKYLDEYGDKKVVVKAHAKDTQQLLMLWGVPYEVLLLSECERGKPASIILDEDPYWRPWITEQKKSLVVNYNIYPYAQLPPRYFHFTDTVSGYIIDPPPIFK